MNQSQRVVMGRARSRLAVAALVVGAIGCGGGAASSPAAAPASAPVASAPPGDHGAACPTTSGVVVTTGNRTASTHEICAAVNHALASLPPPSLAPGDFQLLVVLTKLAGTSTVSCGLSITIEAHDDVLAMITGGAKVEAAEGAVDAATDDCISAVVTDLMTRSVVPFLRTRTP